MTEIDAQRRILVVEDEVLIRMDLVETLEELGHSVAEAGSAEEAIDVSTHGDFDILLTDMGLPRMSGEDLARLLRERKPGLAVIFATGNNEAPALPVGSPPVLLRKPFEKSTLKQAIDQAIDQATT